MNEDENLILSSVELENTEYVEENIFENNSQLNLNEKMQIVDKVSHSNIKEIITEEINSININEVDSMTVSQLKENLTKQIHLQTKMI